MYNFHFADFRKPNKELCLVQSCFFFYFCFFLFLYAHPAPEKEQFEEIIESPILPVIHIHAEYVCMYVWYKSLNCLKLAVMMKNPLGV